MGSSISDSNAEYLKDREARNMKLEHNRGFLKADIEEYLNGEIESHCPTSLKKRLDNSKVQCYWVCMCFYIVSKMH